MPRIWQILPAAALLATSACVGMVVVHEPVDTQSYYDGAVEYAASKGELRVEVVGNPYGADKRQFDEQVVTSMQGANYGPPVTFTTRASDKTRQTFKVVAVFNAPKGLTAEAVCGAKPKPIQTGANDGGVDVFMSFCSYERSLSQASGYVLAAAGPQDPKFHQLVRQVTGALFPAYDRYDIGGDGSSNP